MTIVDGPLELQVEPRTPTQSPPIMPDLGRNELKSQLETILSANFPSFVFLLWSSPMRDVNPDHAYTWSATDVPRLLLTEIVSSVVFVRV